MFRSVLLKTFYCIVVFVVAGPTGRLWADIIPHGNKPVSHQLVFVDSPLLQTHRLIATPVRGFGGCEEVQAEHPFRFSTKYGTRLYVVPSDFTPPDGVGPGKRLPFPSCGVPINSVTYVPRYSPVASLLTTCKLVEVTEDQIRVEVVQHEQFDARGRPANIWRSVVQLCAIAAVGLIGSLLLWKRTRNAERSDAVTQ